MKNQFSTSKILSCIFNRKIASCDSFKPIVNEIAELAKTERFDVEKGLGELKRKIRRAQIVRISIYSAAALIGIIIGISVFYPKTSPVEQEKLHIGQSGNISFTKEVELLISGNRKIRLPDSGKSVVKEDNEVATVEKGEACLSFREEKTVSEETAVEYHILRIPRKVNYKLELADGSRVYLNSETEIAFPAHFGPKERRLILKYGEAYFEIAKNPESPFIVETNHAELQVLGTSFNVNSYTEDITATLIEGSLKVKCPEEEVVLTPGKQARIEKGGIEVSEADETLCSAWKNGLFAFRRLDLESILKTMQRWYDFEYVFKNDALKKKIFTGVIDKNKDKEQAFSAICKATGIKITEDRNHIVIIE